MELSHVRQLQEAVWLFVGGILGDVGMQIQCTGTMFRHFAALSLDSQVTLPCKNAYIRNRPAGGCQ